MFDFHVHTCYSDDCSIEMESYIQPAIEKGLAGICFTDHVDIEYPCSEAKFQLNYEKYISQIRSLQEKYKDRLDIRAGIEFGMQPHIIEADESFFSNKSFDFVIGSIHAAGKKELYGGDFIKDTSIHQGIVTYFQDLIYCVDSFKSYSVLGHLDAISRYVSEGSYKASVYMEYIEEALKLIIKNGKGIELNTSGKRYGLPDFHPERGILKLYKELGGEIITLGSDSHNPSTLGYSFDEAVYVLKGLGYKYYTIFKQGKAEFIKL